MTGRVLLVYDPAHVGERAYEFGAGAFAVGEEARGVATVDAAPCDEQVVARAPRDATQLHLARRRPGARVGRSTRQREPRVTLDAPARVEERVARFPV